MWTWELHDQEVGLGPPAQQMVATAGSTGHRHKLQKGAWDQAMMGKGAEQLG